MTNTNVASPAAATTAPLSQADPASIRALNIAAGVVQLTDVWQTLMTMNVIDAIPLPDKGDAFTFPKRLVTEKAKAVLTIIWVNSRMISDEAVAAAGYKRLGTPSSPLNCHKIAKSLAPSSEDFAAEEKTIQKIVAAAEAYGLVRKEPFNSSRMRVLQGTEALHRLMLANCANCYDLCAEVAALGSEEE